MRIQQQKEFNSLEFYMQFNSEIPQEPGVYSWVFWPFKEDHVKEDSFAVLIEKLKYFSLVNLNLSEESNTGYKFTVNVRERWFEDKLLGLSPKKEEVLKNYLMESEDNKKYFLKYLQTISFSKPFYVGKADNLYLRLNQHFEGCQSNILNYLSEYKINYRDVLIGFEIIDQHFDKSINSVFEEITQRLIKPGLTKKPG